MPRGLTFRRPVPPSTSRMGEASGRACSPRRLPASIAFVPGISFARSGAAAPRAPRSARRAFASRPPAPPRSLLAALRGGRRFPRPSPAPAGPPSCARPPHVAARFSLRIPHITPPASRCNESRRSATASRPPPPRRLDPVADRRVGSRCSDADGATCSASGACSFLRPARPCESS